MEGSLSACWLAVGPRSAGGSTMVDTKSNAFLGKLNFSHCSLEITDQYYTSEEWAALTSEQREQVCSKRS